MLVMVVLSARSNDKLINNISPELFNAYPNMQSLARAKPENLQLLLGRDISRPKPECSICLMNKVCAYYNGWKIMGRFQERLV